ncbi:MAG: hypothetical protein J6N49_04555 [Alphaproteobacteria bacterium]|nr:hypothetical protein [Alphaproteobacteria bacterium]
MQNLIIRITQENTKLITDDKIGCFILADSMSAEFMAKFTEEAHKHNKLVLTSGNNAVEAYQNCKADGLIIDSSKEEKPQKLVKQIQAQAKKAILGVITRNRRHEAMLVSECEPDFVIFRFWKDGFSENLELLEWYNELFLIQNAVLPAEEIELSNIRSDFIILDDTRI